MCHFNRLNGYSQGSHIPTGIIVKDAFKMKKICNDLEISLGRHWMTVFTETANVLAEFYILKTCLPLFRQNMIYSN